jgi:hypothetical protein
LGLRRFRAVVTRPCPRLSQDVRRPARGPVVRYERSRPGELVQVDIKRLGRFWTVGKAILGDGINRSCRAGWQYLHLAIDDHSPFRRPDSRPALSLRRARHRLVSVVSPRKLARARPPPSSVTAQSACTPSLAAKQLGADRIIAVSRHEPRQQLTPRHA